MLVMLTTEAPFCWYTETAGFDAALAAGAGWAARTTAGWIATGAAGLLDALVSGEPLAAGLAAPLGLAAAGAPAEGGGWLVGGAVGPAEFWTLQARKSVAVVAELTTATAAVRKKAGTPRA
jgi:hypothetical protein